MSPSDALRIAQQVIDEDGKHALSRRNLTHLAKAARDALGALAASHDRALAAEAQLAAVMSVVVAAEAYVNAPSAGQDVEGEWHDPASDAYPDLVRAVHAIAASKAGR